MMHDLQPGSVGDIHQRLRQKWGQGEVTDIIEYTRGRGRPRAAWRDRSRPALRIAARVIAAWIVAALVAHDLVTIAEGSPWPGQWSAGASVSCILIAVVTVIVVATLLEPAAS